MMRCVLAVLVHGFPFVSNFKGYILPQVHILKYLLLLFYFIHWYLGKKVPLNVEPEIIMLSFLKFFLTTTKRTLQLEHIKMLLLLCKNDFITTASAFAIVNTAKLLMKYMEN